MLVFSKSERLENCIFLAPLPVTVFPRKTETIPILRILCLFIHNFLCMWNKAELGSKHDEFEADINSTESRFANYKFSILLFSTEDHI